MSRQSLSPTRLEAFSDGVIGVIIILVLALRAPGPDGAAGLRVAVLATFSMRND